MKIKKKCELNYFNYNFTRLYIRYYEKCSRIQQRIQKSINKQTEYDNLVFFQRKNDKVQSHNINNK